MKSGNKKSVTVEQPEIEIVVRVEEQELAVVAFFSAGGEGWDVVVGIDNPQNRNSIALALETACEAVKKAAFRPLPSNQYERSDNAPPF